MEKEKVVLLNLQFHYFISYYFSIPFTMFLKQQTADFLPEPTPGSKSLWMEPQNLHQQTLQVILINDYILRNFNCRFCSHCLKNFASHRPRFVWPSGRFSDFTPCLIYISSQLLPPSLHLWQYPFTSFFSYAFGHKLLRLLPFIFLFKFHTFFHEILSCHYFK